MGSDNAPHVEIDGALAATRDFGVGVILVGQSQVLEPELRRCGWREDGDLGIELVEAAEVIRIVITSTDIWLADKHTYREVIGEAQQIIPKRFRRRGCSHDRPFAESAREGDGLALRTNAFRERVWIRYPGRVRGRDMI